MEISWQPSIFWGCARQPTWKQHLQIYKAVATGKAVCKSSPSTDSTRLEQECMIDAVGLDRRFHMFSEGDSLHEHLWEILVSGVANVSLLSRFKHVFL